MSFTALPLTVKELMQVAPEHEVRGYLYKDHKVDNLRALDAYLSVQAEIACIQPSPARGRYALTHIQVTLEEFDGLDGSTYLDYNVLGVGPDETGETTTWAIEYVPWEVWAGLRIQYIPPMSREEVAAAILKEMTWNGFSAEAVRSRIADFDRMLDSDVEFTEFDPK